MDELAQEISSVRRHENPVEYSKIRQVSISEIRVSGMNDELYKQVVHPVKVALNRDQVDSMKLVPTMKAKERMNNIKIDKEFHDLIPPMTPEEKGLLEEDVTANGCRDALVVWEGILLDGHNRLEICQRLKLKYKVTSLEFEDRGEAMLWIINNQFGRRNISMYDRGVLALKVKDIIAAKAKKKQGARTDLLATLPKSEPINTRATIAEKAGVSERTIAKIETIQKKATPEQIERIKSGDASINQINNEISKPHVSQNKGENEWYTPKKHIEAARIVMGSIDLDPASSAKANETVQATVYYTKKNSGLDKPWSGKLFMNPPVN